MSNVGRLQHYTGMSRVHVAYRVMSNREDVAAAQHILVNTATNLSNRRCTGDQTYADRPNITEDQRQKQEQLGTAT